MNRDLQSAGLTSIIVPGCTPLESTRQCVAALRRYTRAPWELVGIVPGSLDRRGSVPGPVLSALRGS